MRNLQTRRHWDMGQHGPCTTSGPNQEGDQPLECPLVGSKPIKNHLRTPIHVGLAAHIEPGHTGDNIMCRDTTPSRCCRSPIGPTWWAHLAPFTWVRHECHRPASCVRIRLSQARRYQSSTEGRNRNLKHNGSHNLWSSAPRTDHTHCCCVLPKWHRCIYFLKLTRTNEHRFALNGSVSFSCCWRQGWRNRYRRRIWLTPNPIFDRFIGQVAGIW
jgi:hypothetical protein